MHKKTTLFLFAIMTVSLLAMSPIWGVNASTPKPAQAVHKFVVGTAGPVPDLDPVNAWDSAATDVMDQVLEPLFSYDLTSKDLPLVARLGTAYSFINSTALQITLRQGVKFHDDTAWNAAAAKWNFDRLSWAIHHGSLFNVLFQLPSDSFRSVAGIDLSWIPAGDTVDIINNTQIVDDYTIILHLNIPFSPILDLLTFSGCYMLSPTSHAADAEHIFDITTPILVGTGPFKFVSYSPTQGEAIFKGNTEYWRGAPYVTDLTYSYITDSSTRDAALLSGDVTFLDSPTPSNIKTFQATAGISVDIGPAAGTVRYVGMNMITIPEVAIRKAIAYAINYSYIIDQLNEGYASRLKGPIPPGVQGSNPDPYVATYNLATARKALIDGGIAPAEASSWTDDQWVAQAEGSNPIRTLNYTYNLGNPVREGMLVVLRDNLKHIGIKVTDAGTDWTTYTDKLFGDHDQLQLFAIGWIPDYNNAWGGYIQPLFDNSSSSASTGINDPQIQQWMADVLAQTSVSDQNAIYDKIQKRLMTELYPMAWTYQGLDINAINSAWTGVPSNSLQKLYFYYAHEANSGWTPGQSETILRGKATTQIPGFPMEIVGIFSVVAMLGIALSIRKKVRK